MIYKIQRRVVGVKRKNRVESFVAVVGTSTNPAFGTFGGHWEGNESVEGRLDVRLGDKGESLYRSGIR